MTSGGSLIGNTLTGGIQDISALLPLLGTERREEIGSAVTNGYLYFVATIPIPKFDRARILANAGFEPNGEHLSLIMLDADAKSHLAGKRLQNMTAEPHIKDSSTATPVVQGAPPHRARHDLPTRPSLPKP
jgi:hypothetical protein